MYDVDERVRALTDEIVRLREYETRLARIPVEDDFPDETVIFFRKRFNPEDSFRYADPHTDKAYAFTAMKLTEAESWFMTGARHGGAWSWDRLREFMADGVDLDDAWVVSEWKPAFPG